MGQGLSTAVGGFGPIFLLGLSMCSIISFAKKYLLARLSHRRRMFLWVALFVPPMSLAMWWVKDILGDTWSPTLLAAVLYILGAVAGLELQKWIDRQR